MLLPLRLKAECANQFVHSVKKCSPEFGASAHVHKGIIDAVEEEQVPHVRPW